MKFRSTPCSALAPSAQKARPWECYCGASFDSLRKVNAHQKKNLCTARPLFQLGLQTHQAEIEKLKAQIADLKARIKFANGPASPAQKRRVLDLRVKDWR